jgi:glutathione S-transferase
VLPGANSYSSFAGVFQKIPTNQQPGKDPQTMPTLYHHPMSAASRFVRLVLHEYGMETEQVEERTWEKRRDFLALNPAATLPVYVDDSMHALCGAWVIAEYIDETAGVLKHEHRLMPDDVLQRAEVRRLMDWYLNKLEHDVTRYLVRERVFKLLMPKEAGGGAPDSKALRAARANIRQHMRYLDYLAANRNWLAGNALSYADFAAAAALSTLDYLGEIKWDETEQAKG